MSKSVSFRNRLPLIGLLILLPFFVSLAFSAVATGVLHVALLHVLSTPTPLHLVVILLVVAVILLQVAYYLAINRAYRATWLAPVRRHFHAEVTRDLVVNFNFTVPAITALGYLALVWVPGYWKILPACLALAIFYTNVSYIRGTLHYISWHVQDKARDEALATA